MQYADRIKSTLPSLLTAWKDICERTSQTLGIGKQTFAKNACKYHEPRPIEMPQMEAFTFPDTIQTGGFGIMSGTIQNSQ